MRKNIIIGLVLLMTFALFSVLFIKAIRQSEYDRKIDSSIYDLMNNLRAESLLERFETDGGDPNATGPEGQSVICEACVDPESLELLKILLDAGADPTVECGDYTCLEFAIRIQNIKAIELLLDRIDTISIDELVRLKGITSNPAVKEAIEKKMLVVALRDQTKRDVRTGATDR